MNPGYINGRMVLEGKGVLGKRKWDINRNIHKTAKGQYTVFKKLKQKYWTTR